MCEISEDYFEARSISISRHKARVASKRCNECHAVVKVGESYEKYVGTCEGNFLQAFTCIPCADARKEFLSRHGSPNYIFGELAADIAYCLKIDPESEEWIAKRWSITKEIEDGCVVDIDVAIRVP